MASPDSITVAGSPPPMESLSSPDTEAQLTTLSQLTTRTTTPRPAFDPSTIPQFCPTVPRNASRFTPLAQFTVTGVADGSSYPVDENLFVYIYGECLKLDNLEAALKSHNWKPLAKMGATAEQWLQRYLDLLDVEYHPPSESKNCEHKDVAHFYKARAGEKVGIPAALGNRFHFDTVKAAQLDSQPESSASGRRRRAGDETGANLRPAQYRAVLRVQDIPITSSVPTTNATPFWKALQYWPRDDPEASTGKEYILSNLAGVNALFNVEVDPANTPGAILHLRRLQMHIDFFDEQVEHGHTPLRIVRAVYRVTNGRLQTAAALLQYERGQDHEEGHPGIWTEEEDEMLRGEEQGRLLTVHNNNVLERRHGDHKHCIRTFGYCNCTYHAGRDRLRCCLSIWKEESRYRPFGEYITAERYREVMEYGKNKACLKSEVDLRSVS
jgi:hypothetical protein